MPSGEKKTIFENALEIIYEFGRHFWPTRDFRAIFWDFHIMKSDQSKNVSGYGLYEYIHEEKTVKKNLQKKWHDTIWRNSRLMAEFQLCGHFLNTFTKSKLINRKMSRGIVSINTLVKKKEWKKFHRKNGTRKHTHSTEFFEY